jgi:hypothetical protein
MKTILIILLATFGFAKISQAQTTPQVPQSLDSLQNKVMKLMQFYDSYDDGSPESLKKAKYNDAVNEISGGTATQSDKDQAYKIIDAYIKGDKALEQNSEKKEKTDNDFNEAIGNTDEAKAAMNYVNQQASALQNMSYSEFENYVEKASPFVSKTEVKRAYNALHKSDGKQVSISTKDEEMTDAQKQMWAFDVLSNPKNYEEACKALKILKPEITESELKAAWAKRNKQ